MVSSETSPTAQIGWGFIGCGGISATCAAEMAQKPDGNLVCVYGRNIERATEFATKYGFERACGKLEELLADSRVDAVYIALPHSLHIDCILMALDAGKHILCEKPLAMSLEEVERVKAHPRSSSLMIAEGFMVRHHPQWHWICERIAAGDIGEVRAVQSHTCFKMPPAPAGKRLPGQNSLLRDIGCYPVYLARLIFGQEVTSVSAIMDFEPETGRDTSLSAQMNFPGGSAQLIVSGSVHAARRLHIIGTNGSIEVLNPIHPRPDGSVVVRLTNAEGSAEEVFERAPQYGLQFQNFAHAVASGQPPLVSLEDAWGNARTIDALFQSATLMGASVALD